MMKTGNENRSIFVEPPIIAVQFVLCLVSAFFGLHLLTGFLIAILIISVSSNIWGRHSLRKLSAKLDGRQCCAFPGEKLDFTIDITNGKTLPLLWLKTEYFDHKPSCLEAGDGFSRRFLWLMSWQTVSWDIEMIAKNRGIAVLDRLFFTSGDCFGLYTGKNEYRLQDSKLLVVYPQVFNINADQLVCETSEMFPAKKGYIEDNTLFRGTRDYQSGDSSRFINWRTFAKQGRLEVNLFEPVVPQYATFILDLQSFASYKFDVTVNRVEKILDVYQKDDCEDMISLVASCICALTAKGIRCTLVLPGYGERKQITEISQDISMQVQTLLMQLAGIDYAGQVCLFDSLSSSVKAQGFGQIYVASRSVEELTCRKLIENLDDYRLTLLLRHESFNSALPYKTLAFERLRNDD